MIYCDDLHLMTNLKTYQLSEITFFYQNTFLKVTNMYLLLWRGCWCHGEDVLIGCVGCGCGTSWCERRLTEGVDSSYIVTNIYPDILTIISLTYFKNKSDLMFDPNCWQLFHQNIAILFFLWSYKINKRWNWIRNNFVLCFWLLYVIPKSVA